MKTTTRNLMALNGVFVMTLVTANVCAGKIVSFGSFTVPAAVVAYPLTFLMTDVIGELWGREEANATVRLGFFCQLLSSLLILLAIRLPVAPFADNQLAFQSVLGNTLRVFVASMLAYLVSQSVDVFLFHRLKDRWIAKHGVEEAAGGRFIRNNLSTMTSQLIDTVIFITVAFAGSVPNLGAMILGQYLIKLIYAILDTPFFYLLTNSSKQKENLPAV